MKIFDTRNPRLVATAALAVVSLAYNAQGAPDPRSVRPNGAHFVVSAPDSQQFNVLDNTRTPWTITCATPVDGDYLVVQGVVFTAKAAGATGNQFNIGVDNTATAVNLAAVLNAYFGKNVGAWFTSHGQQLAFQAEVAEDTGAAAVTATISIEVSVDGVNPVIHPDLAAFSFTGTGKVVGLSKDISAYPFVRANVSAMTGTAAYAQVFMHELTAR